MKKYIKELIPAPLRVLLLRYRELRRNSRALKKTPNLTADPSVEIIGNCSFEEGVRAGKNVSLMNVSVGRATYFSSIDIIVNATIGKYCSIAPNVKIGLGAHSSKNFVTSHPAFYLKREKLGICYADKDYVEEYPQTTIGNDVWIGEGALIKEGITIGNGAIVGAGAVVVKNVSPYSIVGGVPAKVIRFRFDEKEIEFLEKFKWWDKSDQWLKENWKDFLDIKQFIKKHS